MFHVFKRGIFENFVSVIYLEFETSKTLPLSTKNLKKTSFKIMQFASESYIIIFQKLASIQKNYIRQSASRKMINPRNCYIIIIQKMVFIQKLSTRQFLEIGKLLKTIQKADKFQYESHFDAS